MTVQKLMANYFSEIGNTYLSMHYYKLVLEENVMTELLLDILEEQLLICSFHKVIGGLELMQILNGMCAIVILVQGINLQKKYQGWLKPVFCFFFQVLRLYATFGVMTDLESLLRTKSSLACAPSFSMSALSCRCD